MNASPIPERLLLEQAAFLRALARRLVQDPGEAEDLVQETWVRALERPPRRAGALRSWLARVLRNLAANRARARVRRDRRESEARTAPEPPTPQETSAHREELARLVQALHELDERDYQVVHLRYFEDLPVAEIARRLGLEPDTAKVRLRRALEKIRCSLDRLHGGSRSRWCLALACLARLPVEAPAAGAGLAGAALPVGVLIMSLKTKLSLAALCLLLVGLLGWALLAPPGFLSSGTGGGSAAVEPLAAGSGGPALPAADTEQRAAGARQALPPAGPESGLESHLDLLEILVVEQATGEPVPGAEVLVLRSGQGPCLERYRVQICHAADVEAWMRTHAAHQATDDQGRAWIPRVGWNTWIHAANDGRADLRALEPWDPADRIRLELAAVPGLEVEVVDRAGRPQEGVPLALLMDGVPCLTGATGASGRALLPQAHLLAREAARRKKGLLLALACPLASPVAEPLPKDAFPDRPIRLILPPTGRVTAKVHGLDGRPVEDDALAMLDLGWGLADKARAQGPSGNARIGSSPRAYAPVRNGLARFPHVGLGLHLKVGVVKGDLGWAAGEAAATGPGPKFLGEEVVFEVGFDSPRTLLAGRAVDQEGRPVANHPMAVAWMTMTPDGTLMRQAPPGIFQFERFPEQATTDAAGRFRLLLPERLPEVDRSLSLTARILVGDEWRSVAALIGIAGVVLGQVKDLGDVILAPAPLLAAGRVVDETGAGVPRAMVQVIEDFSLHSARPDLLTCCDGDGRFAIRGLLDRATLGLQPFKEGETCIDSECTVVSKGTTEIELRIARGGTLAGRLLMDPGSPVEQLEILLARFKQKGRTITTHLNAGQDGCFRSQVPPGIASLRFRVKGEDDPVLAIEGIEILASESCRDPRLEAIDLRSPVRCLRIACRDESGLPIPDARASILRPRPSRPFDGILAMADREGVVRILTSKIPLDLQLGADGFRPSTLDGVAGDRGVVLKRCLPLRLVLTEGVGDLVPEPFRLLVLLRGSPPSRAGKDALWSYKPWWEGDGSFSAEGEALAAALEPGTWWLEWRVVRYREGWLQGMTVQEEEPRKIVVDEAPGEQVFRLDPPRAGIAEAVTRVRARLEK